MSSEKDICDLCGLTCAADDRWLRLVYRPKTTATFEHLQTMNFHAVYCLSLCRACWNGLLDGGMTLEMRFCKRVRGRGANEDNAGIAPASVVDLSLECAAQKASLEDASAVQKTS